MQQGGVRELKGCQSHSSAWGKHTANLLEGSEQARRTAKLPVPSKGQPEVQHLGMGIPLLEVALGQLKAQCCVSSQEMCTKRRIFCGGLLRWVGAPPQLGGEECWLCLAWRRERDVQIGHTELKMAQWAGLHTSIGAHWGCGDFLSSCGFTSGHTDRESGPASSRRSSSCIFLWFLQWPKDLVVAEGGSSKKQGEQGERERPDGLVVYKENLRVELRSRLWLKTAHTVAKAQCSPTEVWGTPWKAGS